jgi:hypothetical protein
MTDMRHGDADFLTIFFVQQLHVCQATKTLPTERFHFSACKRCRKHKPKPTKDLYGITTSKTEFVKGGQEKFVDNDIADL